jgi:hypothetical protein
MKRVLLLVAVVSLALIAAPKAGAQQCVTLSSYYICDSEDGRTKGLTILTDSVSLVGRGSATIALLSGTAGTARFYIQPELSQVLTVTPSSIRLTIGVVVSVVLHKRGVPPPDVDTTRLTVIRDDGATDFVNITLAEEDEPTPPPEPQPAPTPEPPARLDAPTTLTFHRSLYCWVLCQKSLTTISLPQYADDPPGVAGYLTGSDQPPVTIIREGATFTVRGANQRGTWSGKLRLAPGDPQATTEVSVEVKHGWPLPLAVMVLSIIASTWLERAGRFLGHRGPPTPLRQMYPPIIIAGLLVATGSGLVGAYRANHAFGSLADYLLLAAITFASSEAAQAIRRGLDRRDGNAADITTT